MVTFAVAERRDGGEEGWMRHQGREGRKGIGHTDRERERTVGEDENQGNWRWIGAEMREREREKRGPDKREGCKEQQERSRTAF